MIVRALSYAREGTVRLFNRDFSILPFASQEPPRIRPLTRPDFYRVAAECRHRATELARFDQSRVNLQQCHDFNQWRQELRGYDRLAPTMAEIKAARPIARHQLMIIGAVIGVIALFGLPSVVSRGMATGLLYAYLIVLVMFFFVPEGLYGSTVEHLEGKTLRVVDELERILLEGDMGFTPAAFFQVKENLTEARRELRQQIDLAHRRWH